ncbi:MAG: HNH endonuclease [Planctomycetes bacterium]|nr:HNH endonuclease [Planctomycetota bacterium]
MSRHALVLNRNWTAVATVTVHQALVLICRDTAAAICPETYEVYGLDAWLDRSQERAPQLPRERLVLTPNVAVETPEVLLLVRYSGLPRLEVSFSRRNLYRRDGYACQYCGRRATSAELSIDHVVPRSRGGETSWENCVLACVRCNTKKANKSLRDAGMRLEREPRRPRWSALVDLLPAKRPASWSKFLG